MKKIFLLLIGAMLFSCSDFLDTTPKDQLSSATVWQTEDDAFKAMVGCYSGWISGSDVVNWDCTSDIGFDYHPHEGYLGIANGVDMSGASIRLNFYDYTNIRRCNNFLANIDKIKFNDDKVKNSYIAQVRVIRAYRYYLMNSLYGGVPMDNTLFETAEEAQVAKSTEQEVYDFIQKELAETIPNLDKTVKSGYIGQGVAWAIKMRSALAMNDYAKALEAAKEVEKLNLYDLEPVYSNLFKTSGTTSKEVIYARQFLTTIASYSIIQMYNNADGGWSSTVPTRNLVDMYEMVNGLTKEEAGSGYNPEFPFNGRDPRMEATILYPGKDWQGRVINTLDKEINGKTNDDHPEAANNASKTGLSWGKYTQPMWTGDQGNTSVSPINFRYAEVLLTIAECNIEIAGGDLTLATDMLDKIRGRAGMPLVDRAKYNNQAMLRQLLRRERCVELAGEGLRRSDIVRWKTDDGKLLAQQVLNQDPMIGFVGTIVENTNPFLRAQIDNTPSKQYKMDARTFKPHYRYLPFQQDALDKNPRLVQNDGYTK